MTVHWMPPGVIPEGRSARAKRPTDGEAFALQVALLLHRDMPYESVQTHDLVFQEEDFPRVAEVFEYRLPEFAGEFGTSDQLRQRLAELVGIRVTHSREGGPHERA